MPKGLSSQAPHRTSRTLFGPAPPLDSTHRTSLHKWRNMPNGLSSQAPHRRLQTLFGLAPRLGLNHPISLRGCIKANGKKLLRHGNDQTCCNICYAIAVSDYGKQHNQLLVDMWNQALQIHVSRFMTESLRQLAQVEAFSKADGITLKEPPADLRQEMRNIDGPDRLDGSRAHKQISGMLTQLGFHHENEVPPLQEWDMGDMLAIDMACPKQKIAIEFNGPSHYLKSVGTGDVASVENGATKAKRRFLERVGWKVINLNYLDWIEVYESMMRASRKVNHG
eukprot:scaffold31195_cov44-Attheya_sp.AAC.1